jgi:hypothetical protein
MDRIREWFYLRNCRTLLQFEEYVITKLKTPERVANWIDRKIWYDKDETPNRWRTVEDTLTNKNNDGDQHGNCTELSCLFDQALSLLPAYKHAIAVVQGEDENYIRKGHAVCLFSYPGGRGVFGSLAVSHLRFYTSNSPWAQIIVECVPTWQATLWRWTDNAGKKIPSPNI